MLTCVDVSQSGDCVCFGDTAGVLHHWTALDDVMFNDFSQPTVVPDYAPPRPPVQLTFSSDLSAMPLPVDSDREPLLSDWPPTLTFGVRQPHPIPESILSQLKQKDFVGYATNTGVNKLRRNQAQPQLAPVYPSPVQLLADTDQPPDATPESEEEPSGPKTPRKRSRPPKRYRVNQVNLSRLDNDTSSAKQYNKTSLGSLEYTQPESYCNALLLALYNIERFRVYCTNHLCNQEFCVTCELGFLFHMLNIADGRNCHSSNVIRAVRMVPGSDEAGILLDDSVETSAKNMASADSTPSFSPSHWRLHSSTAFTHILERFARFLFGRMHTESLHHTAPAYATQPRAAPLKVVEDLFGFECKTSSCCLSCGHEVGVENSKVHLVSLGYPNLQESAHTSPSFATILRKSLCGEFELMDEDGMCPECSTYQPIHSRRELRTLPHKLCVLANVNEERMQIWRPRQDDLTDSPSRGNTASSNSWFPSKLRISLDTSASPSILSIQELAGSNVSENAGVYRLTALVCNVHDHSSTDLEREHFVTYVYRVPAEGSTKPQWYLMNDVIVSKVPEREVMSFNDEWKVPSVMIYELVAPEGNELVKPLKPIESVCPITKGVFEMKSPFKQQQKQDDVDIECLPKAGDLVALDAEFVWVGPREPTMQEVAAHEAARVELSTPSLVALSEQRIKRPGRFSLARVSVIFAPSKCPAEAKESDMRTVIDDYIATQDIITDYLTRFSGIVPGDLDPDKSPHHITTLKHAYVRLRYLVDVGCKFVGHGLAKDFRMINILVPREQVVDTVLLFHRRQQRMIKLRFLAAFLLDVDIQRETHCSVEDARTALHLYERYLELSQDGCFDAVLGEIYRVGRECHWDIGCLSPEDRARAVALAKPPPSDEQEDAPSESASR
eukprot:TRINITY_DN8211_c0_g1_i1.p1 TRINITY_DN8211_c0_g1~~TRINITY_DN8211_c0_g1_i1.p1  ORF type:complete len:1018 (+),score=282.38 TRINITY_DN8211_c0_g1_i1:365-3055(+)